MPSMQGLKVKQGKTLPVVEHLAAIFGPCGLDVVLGGKNHRVEMVVDYNQRWFMVVEMVVGHSKI